MYRTTLEFSGTQTQSLTSLYNRLVASKEYIFIDDSELPMSGFADEVLERASEAITGDFALKGYTHVYFHAIAFIEPSGGFILIRNHSRRKYVVIGYGNRMDQLSKANNEMVYSWVRETLTALGRSALLRLPQSPSYNEKPVPDDDVKEIH